VTRFFDVALGLAALILAGRLEQYPGLKLVAATAGGGIALVANRLDQAQRMPARGGARVELTRAPSDYLRDVYVDTANSSAAGHAANIEVMGPARMLFGTDSPPLATPLERAVGMVRELPISAEEQDLVLGGNARELFDLR
jgi:aminocarboxymuconate-semialdehyde decarboxylase